jgi:ectoine hydroxylase
MPDRYPTRVPRQSEMIDRDDPTVWSKGASGPLSPDVLASYEATGCSTVKGLLSPAEVGACRDEMTRLTADVAVRADDRVVMEKGSGEIRSIFEVHKTSRLVAELVRDPRVLSQASQLLGHGVYVHQSRVNFMPGYTGTGFYWHSDFETWHAEDGMAAPRAVTMVLTLTDNHPYNGSLMVMPGSHRTFVPCVGQTPADHYKESLREQEIGVPSQDDLTRLAGSYGIDQFTGTAGSALWFDANIMHGSGNNITPFPRSNIFVVFNSVANALVSPFAASGPRPTFVASRDFTPLEPSRMSGTLR